VPRFLVSVVAVAGDGGSSELTVICRSQWSSGSMPRCGVRGPRFESHFGLGLESKFNIMFYFLAHSDHAECRRSFQVIARLSDGIVLFVVL